VNGDATIDNVCGAGDVTSVSGGNLRVTNAGEKCQSNGYRVKVIIILRPKGRVEARARSAVP